MIICGYLWGAEYIQLYFYEINFLYFARFSVRSSLSELEAVHIFKLTGQNACHDGHMYIPADMYTVQLYRYEPNIIYFTTFSEFELYCT